MRANLMPDLGMNYSWAKMRSPKRIEAYQARAVGVAAQCDPRSVIRVVNGERVRPMILARIRAALEGQGLAHLLPDAAASEQPMPGPQGGAADAAATSVTTR